MVHCMVSHPFLEFLNFSMSSEVLLWDTIPIPKWKKHLPTWYELHITEFGKPSKNVSFIQEVSFETCLVRILTSEYLSFYHFASLCDTHTLVPHLTKTFVRCHSYDLTWIAYEDPFWVEKWQSRPFITKLWWPLLSITKRMPLMSCTSWEAPTLVNIGTLIPL